MENIIEEIESNRKVLKFLYNNDTVLKYYNIRNDMELISKYYTTDFSDLVKRYIIEHKLKLLKDMDLIYKIDEDSNTVILIIHQ